MPTYTVKPGDSSFSIAGKTLDSQRAFQFLMDSNPQIDWANLKPGQTVNIPDPDEFSGVVTESSLDNIREINIANKIGGATGDDFGQGTSTGNFDDIFGVPGVNDGMINPYLLGQTPQQAPGLESEQADARTSSAIRRNLDDASRRSGALNGASPWTNRSLTSGGDTGVPEGAPSPGGLGIGVNLPSIETTNNGVSNTIDLPSFGIGVQLPQIPDNFSAGLGFTGIDSSFSIDGTGLGINAPAGNFGLGANIPQPQAIPGTTIDPLQASIERNPINDLNATAEDNFISQQESFAATSGGISISQEFQEQNNLSDLQMAYNGMIPTVQGWIQDPEAQAFIQDAEANGGQLPTSGLTFDPAPFTYYTGQSLGLGGGGYGGGGGQAVANPVKPFSSRGVLINWRTGGF